MRTIDCMKEAKLMSDHEISNAVFPFINDEIEKQHVIKAQLFAEQFAKRAAKYDQDNQFPFENFADLSKENFHLLTVPKDLGGQEISLTTFLLIQETLATGCGSTALGLGWHLGIVLNERVTRAWSPGRFADICQGIVKQGRWLNSLSTEPSTGSPSRGRRHQTTAIHTNEGWVINGHKTWATLSPILDDLLITAAIEGTDELGTFVVQKEMPGLTM